MRVFHGNYGRDRFELFSLNENDNEGWVHFITAPDWENPLDSNGDNIYKFNVQATDVAGNNSEQAVSITVTDIDDTPPLIKGPSGNAGDLTSNFEEKENINSIVKFSANEEVQWLFNGGSDVELLLLLLKRNKDGFSLKKHLTLKFLKIVILITVMNLF